MRSEVVRFSLSSFGWGSTEVRMKFEIAYVWSVYSLAYSLLFASRLHYSLVTSMVWSDACTRKTLSIVNFCHANFTSTQHFHLMHSKLKQHECARPPLSRSRKFLNLKLSIVCRLCVYFLKLVLSCVPAAAAAAETWKLIMVMDFDCPSLCVFELTSYACSLFNEFILWN